MFPRGIVLEKRGWKTKSKVVTFVECTEYNYKNTKSKEN